MDRMGELDTTVQQAVHAYDSGEWFKTRMYTLMHTAQKRYGVILVPNADYPFEVDVRFELMVRLDGNYVVIEKDMSDKPFWEDLLHLGIPRDRIVTIYTGEALPVNSPAAANQ